MPSRVFWLFVLEYRSSFSAEFSLLCLQFLYMSLNTSPCLRSASRNCPRQNPPASLSVFKKPLLRSVIFSIVIITVLPAKSTYIHLYIHIMAKGIQKNINIYPVSHARVVGATNFHPLSLKKDPYTFNSINISA